jgi:type VI secretion system protein ImpE
MNVTKLYLAGKLDAAIDAAMANVKSKPLDSSARVLLCDLFCFRGDYERADKQLEVLSQQDPSSALGVALYRQLIRGAIARRQFYQEGRLPEFLTEPSPIVRQHLEASISIREGDGARSTELLVAAEEQRAALSGTCGGTPFDDFRDWDDLTSCIFEVITPNGKYYWVPMDQVEQVELRPVKSPRDVLWRAARMVVVGGLDGEVYLPSLYAGSETSDDDELRCGRAADWIGAEGQFSQGVGMRTFMIGEENRPLLELEEVRFLVSSENVDKS